MLMSCQDLVNEAVVSRAAEAAARQIPPLWPLSSSVAVNPFLGQSEGDTVGAALSQLGNTADNLAGSAHTFAEAEVIKLVEPLEEYTRMLQSIKTAIGQRNTKKFAYVNCLIDVEAKTQAYQKLQGVPGKEAQAEQKQQAVTTAQDGADAAKAEFEKVSERLLTEFELFKNQKAFDIKEIMTNFVNLQVLFVCV